MRLKRAFGVTGGVWAAVLFLVGFAAAAHAGRMVLRIRAGNPIDQPQEVEIKSNLPARIRTNHVLRTGGLDLRYDVRNDVYYVHGRLNLGPREVRVFDIEMEDIWVVPEEELQALRDHAAALSVPLQNTPYADSANALREEVVRSVEEILDRQRAHAIARGVSAVDHIRAFDVNTEILGRVRRDVGRLENLALGSGHALSALLGDGAQPVEPVRDELPAAEHGSAVYRIEVRNTSPDRQREVSLRRDLPPEIRAHDVLDAAGLAVGTEPGTGYVYVHADRLVLDPGQTLVFDVLIRDKWNVNAPRIRRMRGAAEGILERLSVRAAVPAVRAAVGDVMEELSRVERQAGPETVGEEYVAFYRRQAERLDDLEQKLARIESAMRPIEKTTRYGFDVKAPSMKTTWLIIYIILGFLALVSLLFFLRWYGGDKGEQGPASGTETGQP